MAKFMFRSSILLGVSAVFVFCTFPFGSSFCIFTYLLSDTCQFDVYDLAVALTRFSVAVDIAAIGFWLRIYVCVSVTLSFALMVLALMERSNNERRRTQSFL